MTKISLKGLFSRYNKLSEQEIDDFVNRFYQKNMKISKNDYNNLYFIEDFRIYQEFLKFLRLLDECDNVIDTLDYFLFKKDSGNYYFLGCIKGKKLKKLKKILCGDEND